MCCRCSKTRAKITWALLECLFFSGLLSGWYLVISQMKSQDFFGSNCANISLSEADTSIGVGPDTSSNSADQHLPYLVDTLEKPNAIDSSVLKMKDNYVLCVPPLYQKRVFSDDSFESGTNPNITFSTLLNLVSSFLMATKVTLL